jgi:hypothetical protein
MRTSQIALAITAALALASSSAHADEPAATPEQTAKANPDVKPEAKAPFREHGRIGIVGALTEDLWKGGIIFEHEHFEIQALAHAGPLGNDHREIDVGVKAGGRVNLGTLNYLAFGGDVRTHPGARAGGFSTSAEFQAGPYVSLERYFAATPVMMVLWVNPIQYEHAVELDGTGGTTGKNNIRIFQSGGFGLAYLFF